MKLVEYFTKKFIGLFYFPQNKYGEKAEMLPEVNKKEITFHIVLPEGESEELIPYITSRSDVTMGCLYYNFMKKKGFEIGLNYPQYRVQYAQYLGTGINRKGSYTTRKDKFFSNKEDALTSMNSYNSVYGVLGDSRMLTWNGRYWE